MLMSSEKAEIPVSTALFSYDNGVFSVTDKETPMNVLIFFALPIHA